MACGWPDLNSRARKVVRPLKEFRLNRFADLKASDKLYGHRQAMVDQASEEMSDLLQAGPRTIKRSR